MSKQKILTNLNLFRGDDDLLINDIKTLLDPKTNNDTVIATKVL